MKNVTFKAWRCGEASEMALTQLEGQKLHPAFYFKTLLRLCIEIR
jgi:hypothetical protein